MLSDACHGPHVLHVDFSVLVGDDFNRRWKLNVAADVIAVRMRVDDRRYGLIGQALDFIQDRLAPAGVLGVHNDDTVGSDEHCRISAAPLEYVKVVLELIDLNDFRCLGAACRLGSAQYINIRSARSRPFRDENQHVDLEL